MPKYKHKEVIFMLNDFVLEKIFMHPIMQQFCLGVQSDIANMIQEILERIEEENPDGKLSELLS